MKLRHLGSSCLVLRPLGALVAYGAEALAHVVSEDLNAAPTLVTTTSSGGAVVLLGMHPSSRRGRARARA